MAEHRQGKRPERRERWWVEMQHDEVKVVQSEHQPSLEVKDGERSKVAHGPFESRELAQERADDLYSRTLKGMMEKAGM